MMDNLRSPISVRTKSKKAEIYLWNKLDVIKINENYTKLFEKIYKKSSYNFEQIMQRYERLKKTKFGIDKESENFEINIFNKNDIENKEKEESQKDSFLKNIESIESDVNINNQSLNLDILEYDTKDLDFKKKVKINSENYWR